MGATSRFDFAPARGPGERMHHRAVHIGRPEGPLLCLSGANTADRTHGLTERGALEQLHRVPGAGPRERLRRECERCRDAASRPGYESRDGCRPASSRSGHANGLEGHSDAGLGMLGAIDHAHSTAAHGVEDPDRPDHVRNDRSERRRLGQLLQQRVIEVDALRRSLESSQTPQNSCVARARVGRSICWVIRNNLWLAGAQRPFGHYRLGSVRVARGRSRRSPSLPRHPFLGRRRSYRSHPKSRCSSGAWDSRNLRQDRAARTAVSDAPCTPAKKPRGGAGLRRGKEERLRDEIDASARR